VAQRAKLQEKWFLHPQSTTRPKCMLPEALEKITWALHRAEALCRHASRSHTLTEARVPGKTIGKDHEKAAQLGA
jgi:hypothetical protein